MKTLKTKICNTCKAELELNDNNFHRRKDGKDGFRNECKKCTSEYEKKYRKSNKEAISEYMTEYAKTHQESLREYRKVYREENKDIISEHKKEYRLKNLEVVREKNNAYKKENRKALAEKQKEYYQTNREDILTRRRIAHKESTDIARGYKQKRKALKNNTAATLTSIQWKSIKTIFDNRCCYCGKEKPLEQEHFQALSKNGEYTINNIIPACRSCNSSKKDKDFFEWYPRHENYSKKREQFLLDFLGYKKRIQQLKIDL